MKKTIFAVKIRAGKTASDLVGLAVILLVIVAMLFVLSLLRYHICQRKTPGRSFMACLEVMT